MKFVILIHSSPQPWGHPTSDHLAVHRDLPPELRERLSAGFDAVMSELHDNGELVGAETLGDPTGARLYRWHGGAPLAVDGPYSESREHLAGFVVVDVGSRSRAEEVAARFSGPGETVELRPMMWPGGDDR